MTTIHVWAEQVVGFTENRHLGDLEEQLLSAITHLEFGKIDVTKCLNLWGQENVDYGRILCTKKAQGFHNRWQATVEPVVNAYQSLRKLCYMDYAPALPKRDTTASHADCTIKRSPASHSTVPLALISSLPAGSAIGFATR